MKNTIGGMILLIAVQAAQAAPDGTTALYEFTFDAFWSAETHPTGFPSNPHFSSLTGATHNGDVSFWEEGELASWGVERVAESGNKGPLLEEVDAAIAEGTAASPIAFRGLSPSPGSFTLTLTSRSTYSQLTIISMIAPSPDWFVGVSGLDLRDDGQWRDEIIIDLWPYDAGTEEGMTFSTTNPATVPPEPIFRIDEFPFQDASPLGTFTFSLLSITPPLIGDMNADGMIDFDDIAGFVLGLNDPAAYEATYGLAPAIYGDTDGSGQIDIDDIAGFVALLGAGAALTAVAKSIPEPSSSILAMGMAGLLLIRHRVPPPPTRRSLDPWRLR